MFIFDIFAVFVIFFFCFVCFCTFSTRARLSQPTSPLTSCRFARLCLSPRRRHGVVARSGAPLVPLGPGQKASQPVHHHPPQRYKPGNPATPLPLVPPPTKQYKKKIRLNYSLITNAIWWMKEPNRSAWTCLWPHGMEGET